MTSKKPSLTAALHEASGKRASSQEPAGQQAAAEEAKASRTSRQQTKLIGGHFDPIVSRQLRQLALDQNSTVQALLAEALNDLFVKHGKKPLA